MMKRRSRALALTLVIALGWSFAFPPGTAGQVFGINVLPGEGGDRSGSQGGAPGGAAGEIGGGGPDLQSSSHRCPDNERLVYVDAHGHMVILNVATGNEENLGPGNSPTWSRDGRFIAYRADAFGQPPGDYFLLQAAHPGQRKQILSNKRSAGDIQGGAVALSWISAVVAGRPIPLDHAHRGARRVPAAVSSRGRHGPDRTTTHWLDGGHALLGGEAVVSTLPNKGPSLLLGSVLAPNRLLIQL